MKKNLFYISIIFLVINLLNSPVEAKQISFKDIPETHKSKKEITFLVEKKIISGYQDGTFKPNEKVKRIQAAIMIARALELKTSNRPNPKLNDVKLGDYGYEYIATVIDEGIFPNEGMFRPSDSLTRGEMAVVLANAFQLKGSYAGKINDVSKNQSQSVSALAAAGITNIYEDGTFKPTNVVNREQFSVFLARSLNSNFRTILVSSLFPNNDFNWNLSKEDLLKVMGNPSFEYGSKDGNVVALEYKQKWFNDEQETITYSFVNGKLTQISFTGPIEDISQTHVIAIHDQLNKYIYGIYGKAIYENKISKNIYLFHRYSSWNQNLLTEVYVSKENKGFYEVIFHNN